MNTAHTIHAAHVALARAHDLADEAFGDETGPVRADLDRALSLIESADEALTNAAVRRADAGPVAHGQHFRC